MWPLLGAASPQFTWCMGSTPAHKIHTGTGEKLLMTPLHFRSNPVQCELASRSCHNEALHGLMKPLRSAACAFQQLLEAILWQSKHEPAYLKSPKVCASHPHESPEYGELYIGGSCRWQSMQHPVATASRSTVHAWHPPFQPGWDKTGCACRST